MKQLKEGARAGDAQPQVRIIEATPEQASEILRLVSGKGVEIKVFEHRRPQGSRFSLKFWREWMRRDLLTGPLLEHGLGDNLVLDSAKATLLQRLFGVSGSSRSMSQIAVGEGTTAPTSSDVGLEDQVTFKAIASVDQSGEASIPPSRVCVVTFGSSEANGVGTSYIRELGFLFDNNVIVTRALFAQGTITGATKANPCVITSPGCQAALVAAGGGNGSTVFIEDVGGMVELNDLHFTVANLAANSFELSGINSTGYTTFSASSPETAKWTLEFLKNNSRVLEISYPFAMEC